VLGAKHPSTLTSMNNLATIYHDQGLMKEAEHLMAKCVEARRPVLGSSHSDTKSSVFGLRTIQSRIEEMARIESG
jgi:Tetratricopeptide repeat